MIEKKGIHRQALKDYKEGTAEMGLGIGSPRLDKHLRLKRSQITIILGHDNVGKTYWFLWYALNLSLRHKIKWCMWCGENATKGIYRDLIQMYVGKRYQDIPQGVIDDAYQYLEQFFDFVDNKKSYNAEQLFEVFKQSGADACFIDPFTGLNRGVSHNDNVEFMNQCRHFCNSQEIALYISSHPNSESGRKSGQYPDNHQWATHLRPPLKAHIEGGKVFLNRTDDFIIIHRLTQHPSMKFETMVSIEKVKEKWTGGEPTNLNEELLFTFNNGNGFLDGNIDPLQEVRRKEELNNLF